MLSDRKKVLKIRLEKENAIYNIELRFNLIPIGIKQIPASKQNSHKTKPYEKIFYVRSIFLNCQTEICLSKMCDRYINFCEHKNTFESLEDVISYRSRSSKYSPWYYKYLKKIFKTRRYLIRNVSKNFIALSDLMGIRCFSNLQWLLKYLTQYKTIR